MPRATRIGAVSYLNTKPLIRGLERQAQDEAIELSLDVPSALGRYLSAGLIDVALLPVIELARIGETELVPGLAITTRGAARSVLLLTRLPLGDVRTVALDRESRTSNALVQVLFAEKWAARPRFEPGPADLDQALCRFDAVVRIGDKALFEPHPPGVVVHDLGLAWTEATGLPFVFAAWAARPGRVDRRLYRLLHASRRTGAAEIEQIAQSFSWNGRRDPELVRDYLIDHIHYRLGASEVEAMRRFFAAAAGLGLIDRAPQIRFAPVGRSPGRDEAERPVPSATATRGES